MKSKCKVAVCLQEEIDDEIVPAGPNEAIIGC